MLNQKPTSPSQRLRAVIYSRWETSEERKRGLHPEVYYQNKMQEIIAEQIEKVEKSKPEQT